ncbi:hypothetical protein RJ639_039266 [Escallonia herrerae]|uniref:Peptidase A1 domain-containing protein n=1 Tax=Escallonia herrerae TaxID=1293975 RepID=A0AA89B5H7_9ASTE|nr:hypothetical protein RJ639_039266 [Escallonia herrerae]
MACLAYLKAATTVKSPDDIRGEIITDARGVVFLVNMSIGEPPIPQLLVLDTASRVLWVHCSPCTGCQRDTLFDPSKSSTSYIAGNIVTEKLTFVTSDEGSVDVPNIVFGCGHEFQNPYPSNQGEGNSTPLEIYNGCYDLTLDDISFGDKQLGIDPKVFQRSLVGGGAMIDSGTTLTFLARGAFEPLRSEVENIIAGSLRRVRVTGNPDWLCYKGIAARDLEGFPVVTFHFGGGAVLALISLIPALAFFKVKTLHKPHMTDEVFYS